MLNSLLSVLFLVFASAQSSLAAPVEIQWWHAMSGGLGETLNELAKKFNESQTEYKINPVFRGNYTETLNAAVAAYRGKRAPDLVQVFEVGTATMMSSGAVIPVEDLLKEQGQVFPKERLLKPIASYYSDQNSKLFSLPFNSSTPILYVNLKALTAAGVVDPGRSNWTYEELFEAARLVVKKGTAPCGLTSGWHSWILIENFSAIHNLPFAEFENGFNGLARATLFSGPKVVSLFDKLRALQKEGVFRYEGRRSEPSVNAFTAGRCAMAMVSSGDMSAIKKAAKFEWGAAFLPHLQGFNPQNSIIGGASLWVFNQKPASHYPGIAKFLAFLITPENAAWWHQKTGYLPVTLDAYELSQKSGFYQTLPPSEIPIKQLLRSDPGPYSRGIRLGNFTQIREIIDEELERLWAGRVPDALTALQNSTRRSNLVLSRYARLASVSEKGQGH